MQNTNALMSQLPTSNPSLSIVVSTKYNQQKTFVGSVNNLATDPTRSFVPDSCNSDNKMSDQTKSVKSSEQKHKKVIF